MSIYNGGSKQETRSGPVKVLHILGSSIPQVAGYTIRSKYIVECQKAMGMDPIVLTSPIQQVDTPKDKPWRETINSITYFRCPGTGKTASIYDESVRKGG